MAAALARVGRRSGGRGRAPGGRTIALALLGVQLLPAAAAVPGRASGALPPVEVVAAAPLHGVAVPREALPVAVQSLGRDVLDTGRPATLGHALAQTFAGAHVASAQGGMFQPDVSFRGMTVSPLLGSQSALAVLVDGIRVNESFGDVVLWDLVPLPAIAGVDLVPGGGTVFGPNALGGTLQIRTYTGREFQGAAVEAGGGSFGRRGIDAAFGGDRGRLDGFVAASAQDEDGWRDRSPSRVRQLHGKAGWEDDRSRVAVAYTHARNALTGNGLAPEPLLAADRRAVYTYPDESNPRLHFWTVDARHELDGGLRLAARAYRRDLRIDTVNGDAEYDAGDTPTDPSDDTYEAEFRRTETRQRTEGIAAQVAWEATALGVLHRGAVGALRDRGVADFGQFEQPGEFGADRGVVGIGEFEPDTLVATGSRSTGLYATDTIALGATLHVTIATRYDRARVRIADRSGVEPDLDGDHSFSRFSPSVGAAWSPRETLTLRMAYSEGFRVPTPVELTCASPDDPCALPVAFVADPPLDPVVSRTWEASAQATLASVSARATLYRASLRNDILFTGLGAGRGFFANVPSTRRQGVELELSGSASRLAWRAAYALVDATYRAPVELFNPVAAGADPDTPATIAVLPGDRLPAVPRHLARLALGWRPLDELRLDATVAYASRQYLRGDDANDARPLSGYALVGLRAEQQIGRRLALEVHVDNVLDEKHATVGALNRSAFDATGAPVAGGPGPVQRFLSPGAPRTLWIAVNYRFAAEPAK